MHDSPQDIPPIDPEHRADGSDGENHPFQPNKADPWGPQRYGESFADVYDEWYDDVSDAEATADFVDNFGQNQRILELGIGTGRLALPLLERGHSVVGVDASMSMLERFDDPVGSVAVGADMAQLPTRDTHFDTVLVATNTLFNLSNEQRQRDCIAEAHRALRRGGRLIIEAMVPGDRDPSLDRLVTTRSLGVDHAVLTATIRDHDRQEITGQHIEISESGIRLRPWKVHYLTIDELDMIAVDTQFRLGDRWADWDKTPLTNDSPNAVSVYVAI